MKILVVLPRFPFPLVKGDRLRAFHQISLLGGRHEVYLFCADVEREATPEVVENFGKQGLNVREMKVVRPSRLATVASVLSAGIRGTSLQVAYFDSRAVREAYKEFESKVQPDVVYCQMVRTMPWVAESQCRKVMDFQDALSLNMRRRASRSAGVLKAVLFRESKALADAEQQALKQFDACTIISNPDREAIRGGESVHIVPNGVDTDYFAQRGSEEKKSDIVFCGNMAYEPNVRASVYLVGKVMPLVWRRRPQTTVTIAGANPAESVKRLSGNRNVKITGWVSDIRDAYGEARVFAAPMLTGSGLQNKLLEAMAMGLPCVTTSLANGALGAEPGKQVVVADSAESMADAILRLLEDNEACDRLSQEGRAFVETNYSWRNSVELLSQILEQR